MKNILFDSNAFDGASLLLPLMAIIFCPLLPGIINRVKAFFAGRKGPPVLQLYFDLYKLLLKGPTYSTTTTWVFRAGPLLGLACCLTCLLITPLGNVSAIFAFAGDFILLTYLLGLLRFSLTSAALDTGSAFEGMGASRELLFSMLIEPAIFLTFAVLAIQTDTLSISAMFAAISSGYSLQNGAVYAFIILALFIAFLTENSRIPIDDPNTHLELTMIHEVMVLDHSGPDFAFIQYTAALKMWILGSLIVGVASPANKLHLFSIFDQSSYSVVLLGLISLFVLALITGVIESCTARLRLQTVPRLITGATVLAAIALTFSLG